MFEHRTGTPTTSAIVVVDVQNDFVHPDGALAKGGGQISQFAPLIASLERLLTAAKQHGVPILFVRHENRTEGMSPVWLYKRRQLGREATPVCLPGSWGSQLAPQLLPFDGIEIVKHRHSAFAFTPLQALLQSMNVQYLIVTGLSTNVCVEATVRDAFTFGYLPVVPEDCVASSLPHLHAPSLETMGKYFGVVTDTDEIIAGWNAGQRRDD